MSVFSGMKFSLSLLNARARFMTIAAIVIQVLLSVLDILGIGAIAALAAASVSAIQGNGSSDYISKLTSLAFFINYSIYEIVILFSIIALISFILKSFLSAYLIKRLMTFLSYKDAEVSTLYTKLFLMSSLLNVQKRNSQESIYGLTAGITASVSGILTNLITIFAEASLLILVTVTLLAVDFVSTVITLMLFICTGIIVNRLLGRTVSNISAAIATISVNQNTSLNTNIFAFQDIFAMDRSDFFIKQFTSSRWESAKLDSRMRYVQQLPRYIFETTLLISGFVIAGFLFFSKDAVGAITGLSIFLAAGLRIMPSIQRLQSSLISIRSNLGAAKVFVEMKREITKSIPSNYFSESSNVKSPPMFSVDEGISVHNVDYSYGSDSQLVLNSLNFRIDKGESVGIVGKSGSGKSTLMKILLGLLTPVRGSLKISEMNIKDFKQLFPNSFGYVPQDIYLIPGTIRSNVLFGLDSSDYSDLNIWEALEKSHIANDIRDLDLGLDSIIGERGINLSGGQKQRLGFARAILSNPKFLFLDEATSALDSETEFDIVKAIQKLNPTMTRIVVAHRLATVRDMDKIIYIDGGKIIDIGSFDELIERNSDFANQAKLLGIESAS